MDVFERRPETYLGHYMGFFGCFQCFRGYSGRLSSRALPLGTMLESGSGTSHIVPKIMNRPIPSPLTFLTKPLAAIVVATVVVSAGFLAAGSAQAQPVRLASTSQSASGSSVMQGTATFYHPVFDGKQTANGEVYDHKALTAAHKTLPFDTMVRVTRLDTEAQVVVRINDRLPVGSDRTIDLSGAAASRLDMLEVGVVDVSIEILTPVVEASPDAAPRVVGWSGRAVRPPKTAKNVTRGEVPRAKPRPQSKRLTSNAPAESPANVPSDVPADAPTAVQTHLEKAAPNASNLIYTLQIGSFTSIDGARALAGDYETAWIAEIDVNGRPSYRVYYSRFEDEEPARLAQQSLWQDGQDSFLRRIGS